LTTYNTGGGIMAKKKVAKKKVAGKAKKLKKKAVKIEKKIAKKAKAVEKKVAGKVKKLTKKAVKKSLVIEKQLARKAKAIEKKVAGKVKKLTKKAVKIEKKIAKKAKALKKKIVKKKRTPNPAFMKPMQISESLAKVVGSKPLPRTEVTKKLWEYIKKNQLQDAANKRMINADDNLKKVFGGKKQVSMFEMTKLVSKHLS
jgi:upstream activation factor subunit UAF30